MAELLWFGEWLVGHLTRHPNEGLPEFDDPDARTFYEPWQDAFADRRIGREAATIASKRLVADPPRYRRDHLPTLLAFAVEAERDRVAQGGGRPLQDLSTREGCQDASRDCVRCGGSGLATVRHESPEYMESQRKPSEVSAYCVCALGRWIKRNHAEKSKDVARRIPDLEDAIAGRGPWLPHPMSEPDGEVSDMTPAEMLRAMVRGWRVPDAKPF